MSRLKYVMKDIQSLQQSRCVLKESPVRYLEQLLATYVEEAGPMIDHGGAC